MWKTLGVSAEDAKKLQSHFFHPVTNAKVWVFSDLPHLMKLLRNNVMDHGITLASGEKLTYLDFKKLIQLDNSELRVCHKLTKKHLDCKNQERMRVHMAFEVFSNTVATAMRQHFPQKEEASKFIKLVNDCGDILNSRYPTNTSKNIWKVPFGVSPYEEQQISKLKELYEAIRSMRVGKRKQALYPFQKGFLLTINSTMCLLSDLKIAYPKCQYLLTARLNQDYIENFFSLIRGIGGFHMNPNPTETMSRLKAVALSQNLKHSNNISVRQEDIETESKGKIASLFFDFEQESIHFLENTEIQELEEMKLNSESWSEFNYNLTSKQNCEFGGKEYIAGFLASKFVLQYPELALPIEGFERTPKSWTQKLSYGNFTVPSPEWVSEFIKLDQEFRSFHARATEFSCNEMLQLDTAPNVLSRLSTFLAKKFKNIPLNLIKRFAKTRTMIRINHNNKIIKNAPFCNFTTIKTRSQKSCINDEMIEEMMEYEMRA